MSEGEGGWTQGARESVRKRDRETTLHDTPLLNKQPLTFPSHSLPSPFPPQTYRFSDPLDLASLSDEASSAESASSLLAPSLAAAPTSLVVFDFCLPLAFSLASTSSSVSVFEPANS